MTQNIYLAAEQIATLSDNMAGSCRPGYLSGSSMGSHVASMKEHPLKAKSRRFT